ncbi:MAG: hypothetical protein IJS63_09150 [Bacteroidaceae bacterium]|nr:hypothetical protein [Bacteroidaceae bacterium]
MKKFFAMAAFAAAMIFAACSGGNKATDEALDFSKKSPMEVVSALVEKVKSGDVSAIKTAFETVQSQLSSLLDGKDTKVAEYATQIQKFVEENAGTLQSLNIDVTPLTGVVAKVKEFTGNAECAAQDAADAAQSEAEGVVEGAVDAAEGAVEGAVDAAEGVVNDAVDAGKAAVNDAVEAGKAAVEEGKAKANEAIQNAADQIKL